MKKSQKQTTQKKNTWGGARPGTGPKPKDPSEKAVTVSLSMPGTLHRQLSAKATARKKTVNDAIREAIAAWVESDKKPPR